MAPEQETPSLLTASGFAESDIGTFKWDAEHNNHLLSITNNDQTIEWPQGRRGKDGVVPAWVPASTCLHLHSGHYHLDFVVDEMASRQIGLGFMLLWDVGPDWGFFGYLGASPSAWSYDPTTGDVVTATESIEGNLPKFENEHTGVVSVEFRLPRTEEGAARFVIDGVGTKPIFLPEGAVVLPAACLLNETQKITLANFEREEL